MRRASLVAPLLLITIGALFLFNNLRPELPLFEMAARYWPFVLIGWGVLRLAELLLWASRSRPLPASGISGGEWVLIVFICLIGSGMYAAHGFGSNWPRGRITMRGVEMFGEKFDYNVGGQKEVGKAPVILVDNLRGNARITGADVTEVKVAGRKTIQAMQQADADKANEQSPLEITSAGERVTVRLVQDRIGSGQRISADLEITVPRGATIEARGRYGDFDISDVNGPVQVVSDNAGVRLQNLVNNVRLDLNRSDIVRAINIKGTVDLKGNRCQDVELENVEGQVTIEGGYSGELQFRNLAKPLQFNANQTELRVEKIPGQVRMALGHFTAQNLVGPLRLTGKTRDVDVSDFVGPVNITVQRGDIDLRPIRSPLQAIEARTGLGDIELALPGAAKFELRAVSERGEVENDYGAPLVVESESEGKHRGSTLQGAVGQGPMLKLTTERGMVRIRKASAEEIRAEQPPKALRVPVPPIPPEGLRVEKQ
jgi:DUF4097 and DUF4098 domain-containing protein YvlB